MNNIYEEINKEKTNSHNEDGHFQSQSEEKSTLTYKCPNCGAGLVYDAKKQTFVCKFCISEFDKSDLENTQEEKESKNDEEEKAFSDSINRYICSGCGAEILVDKSTAADFCHYCHNPVVLTDKVSGKLRPTKIIPFKFDKAEAKRAFLSYAKKKIFCPSDYFSEEHSEQITGVYYPFWVTDADASASLDTKALRLRTWVAGDYQYTETSRFSVRRCGNIHFEDITTSAISDEDKSMLEGILPYPMNEHIDFAIPYLQGFRAKKRNIEKEQLVGEVRGKISNFSGTLLRDTIKDYTTVEDGKLDVFVNKTKWDYTLMPIWILTYKKGEKTYVYAMNGSTGKIYGELPVSPWKLAIFGMIIAAVVALIGFLIGGKFL